MPCHLVANVAFRSAAERFAALARLVITAATEGQQLVLGQGRASSSAALASRPNQPQLEGAAVQAETLTLCGCQLGMDDARVLLDRLYVDHTVRSDEAAAAIRFAVATGVTTGALDFSLRDAIKHVLTDDPLTPGLTELRNAINLGCC